MASTAEQVRESTVNELRAQLTGAVITAEDSSYDEARRVVFKGIDKRPLAIARVAGTEDVAAVVNAARDGGLELAVRSGGHSRAGYGTVDGGLVIDLSEHERRGDRRRRRSRLGRDRRDGRQVHARHR